MMIRLREHSAARTDFAFEFGLVERICRSDSWSSSTYALSLRFSSMARSSIGSAVGTATSGKQCLNALREQPPRWMLPGLRDMAVEAPFPGLMRRRR